MVVDVNVAALHTECRSVIASVHRLHPLQFGLREECTQLIDQPS
ncbi:hypothetical protein EES42_41360 [Streptomyces sp. ADI95-17]|nr:hypothetical protein EES42_41360 [Streptomyces sp. ADI95-17]